MDVLAVTVTGAPAVLIILLILVVLILGGVSLVRMVRRAAKTVIDNAKSNDRDADR